MNATNTFSLKQNKIKEIYNNLKNHCYFKKILNNILKNNKYKDYIICKV